MHLSQNKPLCTFEDFMDWKFDKPAYNYIPLKLKKKLLIDCPKTLICHDYAGGYRDDRFCQGTNSYCDYRFDYWPYIDGFIYFSHCFITIPPSGWISAAHTNGVPIYGTIITENADGLLCCEKMFASIELAYFVAERLVQIVLAYNFDGWLLNFENCLTKLSNVRGGKTNLLMSNLKWFCKYLTQAMHKAIPHSMVIWYDSVTIEGDLAWQNELNAKNMESFLACDAIFLNYVWTQDHLKRTITNFNMEPRTMGKCIRDIYVGIDIFGRGMLGGGGLNTHIALQLVRDFGLSAALFAVAWSHEKFSDIAEKQAVSQLFWSSLRPYLYPERRAYNLPIYFWFLPNNLAINTTTSNDLKPIICGYESICKGMHQNLCCYDPKYMANLHCQTMIPQLITHTNNSFLEQCAITMRDGLGLAYDINPLPNEQNRNHIVYNLTTTREELYKNNDNKIHVDMYETDIDLTNQSLSLYLDYALLTRLNYATMKEIKTTEAQNLTAKNDTNPSEIVTINLGLHIMVNGGNEEITHFDFEIPLIHSSQEWIKPITYSTFLPPRKAELTATIYNLNTPEINNGVNQSIKIVLQSPTVTEKNSEKLQKYYIKRFYMSFQTTFDSIKDNTKSLEKPQKCQYTWLLKKFICLPNGHENNRDLCKINQNCADKKIIKVLDFSYNKSTRQLYLTLQTFPESCISDNSEFTGQANGFKRHFPSTLIFSKQIYTQSVPNDVENDGNTVIERYVDNLLKDILASETRTPDFSTHGQATDFIFEGIASQPIFTICKNWPKSSMIPDKLIIYARPITLQFMISNYCNLSECEMLEIKL